MPPNPSSCPGRVKRARWAPLAVAASGLGVLLTGGLYVAAGSTFFGTYLMLNGGICLAPSSRWFAVASSETAVRADLIASGLSLLIVLLFVAYTADLVIEIPGRWYVSPLPLLVAAFHMAISIGLWRRARSTQ